MLYDSWENEVKQIKTKSKLLQHQNQPKLTMRNFATKRIHFLSGQEECPCDGGGSIWTSTQGREMKVFKLLLNY